MLGSLGPQKMAETEKKETQKERGEVLTWKILPSNQQWGDLPIFVIFVIFGVKGWCSLLWEKVRKGKVSGCGFKCSSVLLFRCLLTLIFIFVVAIVVFSFSGGVVKEARWVNAVWVHTHRPPLAALQRGHQCHVRPSCSWVWLGSVGGWWYHDGRC